MIVKICISSIHLGSFGGAQRVVISDARYFAERGHDVHIIATEFDPAVLSEFGLPESVTTHQYSAKHWMALRHMTIRAQAIRAVLKKVRPDAVIAHYHEKATWLAKASLSINPTFVTHVHGSLFWLPHTAERIAHEWRPSVQEIIRDVPGHSEFWRDQDYSIFAKIDMYGTELVEAIALQQCDTVFVNTQQVARELNTLYHVDATVNPPGSNISLLADQTDIDFPTDKQFIFSISRLHQEKRVGLLINAFASLRQRRSDVDLVIGGTGEEGNRLRNLADERGIRDAVHFVGYIKEDEVPQYFAKCEVFACPGWMSYGLTPIEAVQFRSKVAMSTDAFSNEIVGNRPGVAVLSPKQKEWTDGLDALLDSTETPSSEDLPTAEEHSQRKLAVLTD